jgi:uncharacterized protein (TIGR02996 family)
MDENAHLDAVAAHPDDDAPRLAYADWLEAAGRTARAELIRAQLAKPRDAARIRRAEEDSSGFDAAPAWALPPPSYSYARGFLDCLHVDSIWTLMSHSTEILAMRPRPTRFVADNRSASLSPDGSLAAVRTGTGTITESGRVSYAEGTASISVYRAVDHELRFSKDWPYHWNDGDSPSGSDQIDGFWFEDESLVVRFKSWVGGRTREERYPIRIGS